MKKYKINSGHSLSCSGKLISSGMELKEDILQVLGEEKLAKFVKKGILSEIVEEIETKEKENSVIAEPPKVETPAEENSTGESTAETGDKKTGEDETGEDEAGEDETGEDEAGEDEKASEPKKNKRKKGKKE